MQIIHEDSNRRLAELMRVARPSTFLSPYRLQDEIGLDLSIATEAFQITGSFKFRAAYNLAASVPQNLLITASSGNFGQALACACRMLKKNCIVVMPANSAAIKIEATKYWGAKVELTDTALKSRKERVEELAVQHPEAYIASAYDDKFVIEGNSSLGLEIASLRPAPDVVIVPVGGGGLSAGLVTGLKRAGAGDMLVWGAEPVLANDAALSFKKGEVVSFAQEAQTIADGARTLSLGKLNFAILKTGLAGVLEVSEEGIKEAMRKAFLLANLKLEATGALALGAVMENREQFRGKRVLVVASGGNIDPSLFMQVLSGRQET